MSQNYPLISVLISIYNGDKYIKKCLDSILCQSFENFELILVNDGSNDNTEKYIKEYQILDNRIKYIYHKNIGLTKSLNIAAANSRGKYLLRHDIDEFSNFNRFEIQLKVFNDPEVVLVGSNCINLYSKNEKTIWGHYDQKLLLKKLYMKAPFAHGTTMFKKSIFIKADKYDERYKTSQDFDLWIKISKFGKIKMISEPLVSRYIDPLSISETKKIRQLYDSARIRFKHAKGFKIILSLYISLYYFLIALIPKKIFLHIVDLRKKKL